jgi:hypothetical protein
VRTLWVGLGYWFARVGKVLVKTANSARAT